MSTDTADSFRRRRAGVLDHRSASESPVSTPEDPPVTLEMLTPGVAAVYGAALARDATVLAGSLRDLEELVVRLRSRPLLTDPRLEARMRVAADRSLGRFS